MKDRKIVIDKSTVPVGTADRVEAEILSERGVKAGFSVVSNPEFLKEGAAIADFMRPDRIVIGERRPAHGRPAAAPVCAVQPQPRPDHHHGRALGGADQVRRQRHARDPDQLHERAGQSRRAMGADIEEVRLGIGSDQRIGYHFLYPGCGYGGSCFPKDVRALEKTAADHGYDAKVLRAVEAVNQHQKGLLFTKISDYFNGDLAGRTVALWGLSFKPNTDDMREASSRTLMEALWQAGARFRASDPAVGDPADLRRARRPGTGRGRHGGPGGGGHPGYSSPSGVSFAVRASTRDQVETPATPSSSTAATSWILGSPTPPGLPMCRSAGFPAEPEVKTAEHGTARPQRPNNPLF